MTFPSEVLRLLETTGEVHVETRSAAGAEHRVPIWIVVVEGVPYVRSVRGKRGRWWREIVARPGALSVGGRRVPVRASAATDGATVRGVSEAIRTKYPGPATSVASMVRADVLDTTLRLEPA